MVPHPSRLGPAPKASALRLSPSHNLLRKPSLVSFFSVSCLCVPPTVPCACSAQAQASYVQPQAPCLSSLRRCPDLPRATQSLPGKLGLQQAARRPELRGRVSRLRNESNRNIWDLLFSMMAKALKDRSGNKVRFHLFKASPAPVGVRG